MRRTLHDEIWVRSTAIKESDLRPPTRQPNPATIILGCADSYLQRLYTLAQQVEEGIAALRNKASELETQLGGDDDSEIVNELSTLGDQIDYEERLLRNVGTMFADELVIRNPLLRVCINVDIFNDWTVAEASSGEPAGLRPLEDATEKISELLPKAIDGSTIQ